MKLDSLDPRVTRLEIPEDYTPKSELDQWQTWEIFHQQSRGDQHKHVGIVHAPTAELALVFAKEQYGRRMKCVNLWAVKTSDVYCSEYEDEDMFEPAFNKSYREAHGYKDTRSVIKKANSNTENKPKITVSGKTGVLIGKKS